MPIQQAIQHLKQGRWVILVDDRNDQSEGDLVMAAEAVTPESLAFFMRHTSGIIGLSLEGRKLDSLNLALMTKRNRNRNHTEFTVSIEAASGITTGVSATDRAHTIQVAISPNATADDIVSPGHIFPLRAQEGGVLVRAGHTEGGLDLMKLAGLKPAAVVSEMMNEDGTVPLLAQLEEFSTAHDIPIVSIKDIIEYRYQRESLIEETACSKLPISIGDTVANFDLRVFKSLADGTEHVAMIASKDGYLTDPALVRVHSECLTGDIFGSLRCDCGDQLHAALQQIHEAQNGALIYMRRHEGRGIGLSNKIRAYALQEQGLDTVEANKHLGFPADLRHYGIGAQIIAALGIRKLRLLTNNPRKLVGLEGFNLEIVERVPLEMTSNDFNQAYLNTKRAKLGHLLSH